MKFVLLTIITFIGIIFLNPAYALQGDKKSVEATLNNIDATQAMAIANQWKWSKKNVKTYVTPREVVFKFSHGTVKRIPLPEEKMVVAIAPYIKRTHK
jgi:heme/copper-type cytochrome/quinol oxidase subunit 2